MDSKYVDNLIDDDEVPELTEDNFKNSLTFDQLPADLQHTLREIQSGNVTVKPDPVKKPVLIQLSSDVLARFEAKGAGWESKVDDALREWLEEHKAS